MEVKKILCPIKGKTTNDVCTALNAVVPAIETEFGKIDLNTIDIKPDGDNLVLTVSTITEEHPG